MNTERFARFTAALRQHNLDAAVVVPGANLRYLTGLALHAYERLVLLIIPADDRPPALVLPALESERARAATRSASGTPLLHIYPWDDATGPTEALHQAVQAVSGSFAAEPTITVEHTVMRVMELRALEDALPGLRTVDATPILASLRMSKDAEELAAMTEAVQMIEMALRATIAAIEPGRTERQLAAIWKHEIFAAGAEGESFACIVASGPNSANPHHHNSDRPLQSGDMIILDGGAVVCGYASDITRTVALGQLDSTARHVYEVVLAANLAGRHAVRPGTTGEAIDQAARAVIAEAGYGEYFIHRTGHGIGMDCHEPPNIVAGSREPLTVGTTFTVEPGIYIPGVVGVRIEDDMVVTDSGNRSLTTFERELLVLPAGDD